MSDTILVMYSGGLDSVGMLHVLLTHDAYKEYAIHVHHIDINNTEYRADAEAAAVVDSINWFRASDYRAFSFTQSYIGYDAINSKAFKDPDVISFFAGHIASCIPSIVKVAFGVNRDDLSAALTADLVKSAAIFSAFTAVEKIRPVGELTKAEIYHLLPLGVRTKFWSCRTPKYINGTAVPCKTCKTCNQLSEAHITATPMDVTSELAAKRNWLRF